MEVVWFTSQPEKRCHKLSPIPEVIEEDQDCSQISEEEEEKLPSLTAQAVELKQALIELTEICRKNIFTVQTQNSVGRLLQERYIMSESFLETFDFVLNNWKINWRVEHS